MFYNRNNYKNSKTVVVYVFLTILSIMIASTALLCAFLPQIRVLSIVACLVFSVLTCWFYLLLYLKINDYKLKYFLRLWMFNKEFKKLKNISQGNKETIKQLKRNLKDNFLQDGEIVSSKNLLKIETNPWNIWLEESNSFSYPNSRYMEKLSFLVYCLYDACASGGGFEKFFNNIENEPFLNKEIIEIFNKHEFFSVELKEFLTKVVNEYKDEDKDFLFAKYEREENNTLFEFEQELFDLANWIAYNRKLLSSVAGVYIHGNISFEIYHLYLSKDFKKIIYVYKNESNMIRISSKFWNAIDNFWESDKNADRSIYACAELAFNEIKDTIEDYIKIEL